MKNNSVDQEVKQTILSEFEHKQADYVRFAETVRNLITTILSTEKINYNAITCRSKTKESLSEKIERKQGKYSELREITDISGIRVITYYSDDVDRVAEIIEREFVVDKENSIDKRKALDPDQFGYCSVHYVVEMKPERTALCEYSPFAGMKCEIQIRSVLQHAWAEIEHDIGYKSKVEVPKDLRRGFSRIAGLLEVADKEFVEIREYLSNYRERAIQGIDTKEYFNKDIDAVLISALIQTNQDIKLINDTVGEVSKADVKTIPENYEYKSTIERLQWFGIKTVGTIKEMVSDHKNLAIAIIEDYLKDSCSKKKKYYFEDIAFLYLSYAKLVTEYADENSIVKFLEDTGLGDEETRGDFAKELIRIGEEWNSRRS